MTARETKPIPAALWERAGYLRAAYSAAAAADAYVDAYADVDAYDAGMARWAREHP